MDCKNAQGIASPIRKRSGRSLKKLYVTVKVRRNSRGYLFLDTEINSALRIECSTFYSCRVAKLSSSLISPAFVITVNKFMNCAK